MDSRWMSARNLLLVRLDNLGDVLLCTPAFHAVRDTLPEARLTLLAGPVGAQVAEMNPDLDDVIVYESPWMDVWGHLPQDPDRELQMVRVLKNRHFDGAIIFTSFHQSSLPAAYLAYLAGIPLRLAASIDGSGSLLTTRHKHPEKPLVHEVERALELVGAEGFRTSDRDLVLRVPPEELASMRRRLSAEGVSEGGSLVAVHPGCSMPARTYPWELFAEVADLLAGELGCRVVEVGHAERRHLYSETDEVVAAKTRAALRSGLTPIVCIGEDQPMGLASAVSECGRQVRSALATARAAGEHGRVIFAYEPNWAIGADQPADPSYIREICQGIREQLDEDADFPDSDLIYGGSAGPGLLPQVSSAVSGLFLGRFAHDPNAVALILDEVCELAEDSARRADVAPARDSAV